MKIQQVAIGHFRSIETATLKHITDFNVLIGRNNSGKSNLLSCIDLFFSSLRSGDVIVNQSQIGRPLDFNNRVFGVPIDTTVFFAFTLAERDALLQDIVSEVPQIKNAVEGLDPSLLLAATIRVAAKTNMSEEPVVYVRRLALVSPRDLSTDKFGERRIILDVSSEAANQLYLQRQKSRRLRQRKAGLQRYLDSTDAGDWERLRRMQREGGPAAFRHYLTRDLQPDVATTIQTYLAEAASFDEAKNNISSELASLEREAADTDETPINEKLTTITGEVTKVPTYARKLLAKIAELKVLHLRERRKEIGAEEAQKLLELKVSRGDPEVLRGIQDIVQSLLGVQVDAFAAERSSSRAGLRSGGAELDVDNFLVEANGAGIREALRIVLDFEFERPDVLLIEEPEIHLHPGLETSMLRYLRRVSAVCQVFITTHSTNFLDSSDIGNVYLVTKNGTTGTELLTPEDIEEHIPRELGIRLSSLFMFDRLIFVEGKSDENILRELASVLRANLANANAGFITMGGARTFTHFATESTLSFLAKRQVKCWFVIDRDEKDAADIRRLEERLQGRGILCVLNKREVENYLLVPRVLSDYLRFRSSRKNGDGSEGGLSEDELRSELAKVADDLKELTVCKSISKRLCGPNFSSLEVREVMQRGGAVEIIKKDFSERMGRMAEAEQGLEDVAEAVRAELEGSWGARKLDLVPGEGILGRLFERHGLRYRKDRDGPALAARMRESEVHQDLRRIIADVAQEVS